MPTNFLFLIFAVIFVWLAALTFFFWRVLQHYNRLTRESAVKPQDNSEDLLKDASTKERY